MRMSDISEEEFSVIVSYSRFQKDLEDDMRAFHGVELDNKFLTEEKLLNLRDADLELTEEEWLEIQGILNFLNSLKDEKNTFVDLPDNRPIFYDSEGFAYRLSTDYDGLEYRDYIDMGN